MLPAVSDRTASDHAGLVQLWQCWAAHDFPRTPSDPGLADDAGYSIAWGCCGHVFHLDCISRWLKTRSVCPLCNREWEFAKIEKIAMYNDTS